MEKLKEKLKQWWKWIIALIIPVAAASTLFIGGDVQSDTIQWDQEVVEKRDYGAIHYRNTDGAITAIFAGGLHFKDANGEFRRNRTTLVDKGTHFETEQTGFSLRLPKTFRNPKTLSGESWNHTVNSNNASGTLFYVGDTIDSQPIYGLKYTEAYNGVDVLYRPFSAGVHEEYVIKTPASQHSFQVDYPQSSSLRTENGRKEIALGKVRIRDFYVLNNDGKKLREQRTDLEPSITETPAKYIITVPVQDASLYPLTLDPSPFDSDADNAGYYDSYLLYNPTGGAGDTWAELHNNTGSTNVTATVNTSDAQIQELLNMYGGANGHEELGRWGHFVKTSTIGSGSTISSTTAKFDVQTSQNDCSNEINTSTANDAFAYILVASKLSTTSVVTTSDYPDFGDEISAEKAEQLGPELPFDGINAGHQVIFYSTTTYTQYISLTGTTTFGLVVRADQSDVNPHSALTGSGRTDCASGNYWNTSRESVESRRPILLVEYEAAGGAGGGDDNLYETGSFFQLLRGVLFNIAWAK